MSKLGVHVSAGNRSGFGALLQKCAAAGSPVTVVFSVDQDVWPDVAKFSPQTLVVFRHQMKNAHGEGLDGPGDAYVGDPVQSARMWMAEQMASWKLNPAHYYAPINEQDAGTLDGYTWLNDFTLECLRIADANGFKLALYGFSAGNPRDDTTEGTLEQKWARLLTSLQYAKTHGHILLLHEYGLDSPAGNGGPATSLRASAPHMALRYRRSYRYLHPFNADPPLVVSEASAGVGGFSGIGQDVWLADAQWYDSELMRDVIVLGCCLYQLGGDENIRNGLGALGDYIAETPTGAPEGNPVVDMPMEPEPVEPPRTYERVVHLLPQNAQYADLLGVAYTAYPKRETITFSVDDAFVVPDECTSRTVYVYNVAEWGGKDALEAWVIKWYSPLPTIVYREFAE